MCQSIIIISSIICIHCSDLFSPNIIMNKSIITYHFYLFLKFLSRIIPLVLKTHFCVNIFNRSSAKSKINHIIIFNMMIFFRSYVSPLLWNIIQFKLAHVVESGDIRRSRSYAFNQFFTIYFFIYCKIMEPVFIPMDRFSSSR